MAFSVCQKMYMRIVEINLAELFKYWMVPIHHI